MATVITPFVRRWGDGDRARVLLVHGVCAHSGAWWRIGSGLAALGCTVIAPDLRGHGLSPSTESYEFEQMAADLAPLGSEWDLIIAHSLGSPIACLVAADHATTGGVLLLDPFIDASDADLDGHVEDLIAELDPHATAESVATEQPAWHPEDRFHKAIGARSTSPYVVERCLRDNAPYRHLGLLDRPAAAVHILGSDPKHGALFNPAAMDRVENGRVTYEMVAGAGHSLQRERPDAVIEAARSLLGV